MFNPQVVGCCSLGHWKRKPPGAKPGRGDAKSVRVLPLPSLVCLEAATCASFFTFRQCPQFLVNSEVIMREVRFCILTMLPESLTLRFLSQVFSPFELTDQQPHNVRSPKSGIQKTLNDRRNGLADEPSLVDWETLDQGVWNVVRSLKLLPPDVLDASLAVPYCHQRPVQRAHSINCSQLCDPLLNILRPETIDSSFRADVPPRVPSLQGASSANQDSLNASVRQASE